MVPLGQSLCCSKTGVQFYSIFIEKTKDAIPIWHDLSNICTKALTSAKPESPGVIKELKPASWGKNAQQVPCGLIQLVDSFIILLKCGRVGQFG